MTKDITKIQLYDLDADLNELVANLKEFQGTYSTLYERLMDLGSDTFTDDIQSIIDDLLAGYQNGSVLTIQRIENLKTRLDALENKSSEEEDPKYEAFGYDTDEDVSSVTVYDKADPATQLKLNKTDYQYSTVNSSKEIVKSITTIYLADGIAVKKTITKDYGYDANNNVTSITTTVA
jgi:hypothetical protein